MKRIAVFIDGFNIYHRIDDYERITKKNLKWLNYHQLFSSLCLKGIEQLEAVYFFTSIDGKRPASVQERHRNFIGALVAYGVQVYHGVFKYKSTACRQCRATWETPTEKETDVRIACKILELAHADVFDECWLVTGDQDLVPMVQSFRVMFPEKSIKVWLPPMYSKDSKTGNVSSNNTIAAKTYGAGLGLPTVQLGFHLLSKHLLPNVVTDEKKRKFKNPYMKKD